MWRYKFFRYTLFSCPQFYFRCTVGARHERAPNFSCPVWAKKAYFKSEYNVKRKTLCNIYKYQKEKYLSNSPDLTVFRKKQLNNFITKLQAASHQPEQEATWCLLQWNLELEANTIYLLERPRLDTSRAMQYFSHLTTCLL